MKIKNLKEIKELLMIIDVNNGFTREGVFKNEYMEKMIPRVAEFAKKFDDKTDKDIILVNEAHKENSQEFKTYPSHCVKGTTEALIVPELNWLVEKYKVFEKNCTMAIFAPGLINYLDELINLKKVFIAGGVTDICILEAAIPVKKYFDQGNRDIEVVVPTEVVETYDAPWHNREEYSEMAYKLMRQAGIAIVNNLEAEGKLSLQK